LEIRTARSANFENLLQKDENFVPPVDISAPLEMFNTPDDNDDLERKKWRMDIGGAAEVDESEILEQMAWAPKVIYFRHGSEKIFESVGADGSNEFVVPERGKSIFKST
jgi:hypothetical protein